MREGCAYPSPWRGNFMVQFEAGEVDTEFLPYACLDFPHCSASPDQQIQISLLLPLLCSWRRRDTSLRGNDKEKEHPLPLVVVARSFSPFSTALTANKGILPTWQNISRVTFGKARFMRCEKQGAEHVCRAWPGRVGPAWPSAVTQGAKVTPVVGSDCFPHGGFPRERMKSCQLQELGEDVAEGQPAWAAPAAPRVALWVCSRLHQSQLELLNWERICFCSHNRLAEHSDKDYLE